MQKKLTQHKINRILFNGTWAGYLDIACVWNGTTAAVGCSLASGSREVVVKPQVTWRLLDNMNGLPPEYYPD